MRNPYVYSAGAGLLAAIALLFAAIAFPPLLLVAGLSIYFVGLVWGYSAAMLAAAVGVLALSFLPGDARIVLGAIIGVPAVILTAAADMLRSRVHADAQTGWLVLLAAAMGGLVAATVMIGLHPHTDTLRQDLIKAIEQSYQMSGQAVLTPEEMSELADRVIAYLPATIGILATGIPLLNLWLAGRIARAACMLRQSWPDIAALRFPSGTGFLLALSLLGVMTVPDSAGVAATGISSALLFAYLLAGLAVIHFVSRGKSWRAVALIGTYVSLIWLALPVILLGLIDSIYPLRRTPPQAPNDNIT